MTGQAIITVDGPSGAGKGTVCQWLARQLGWHLLDSGALYRVVAVEAIHRQVALTDKKTLARLARQLDLRFELDESGVKTWLSTRDISDQLRTETVAAVASKVAAIVEVRGALLEYQRGFYRLPGLVADGRDMGTVVFPSAGLKVFLTASPEERARRRYKQLLDKGVDVIFADLLQDIKARDKRDRERESSPLLAADDAVEIDSTTMDITSVCEAIMRLVRERGFAR